MAPVDDEYDPAATRTLFVGNIEKTTTYGDLKEAFERYGEIVVSLAEFERTAVNSFKCSLQNYGYFKTIFVLLI